MNLAARLADLTALRDRDELDRELLALVQGLLRPMPVSVRLVTRIEASGGERWFAYAHRLAGAERTTLVSLMPELPELPRLSEEPRWLQALDTGLPQQGLLAPAPGDPEPLHELVLPLTQTALTNPMLLVVHAARAIDAACVDGLTQVFRLYGNLMALLDYGERDTLTELLNRKTFDSAFLKVVTAQKPATPGIAEERRQGGHGVYWLAVMDIDHFKRVNDTYGHTIGDEVLLLVAHLMRRSFRVQDKLYRFGGEEFVVLLHCDTDKTAQLVLDRFREAVQLHTFPQVGHITVSLGFTQVRQMDMPVDAFERADHAVYYAKGHGRNQVCQFEALVNAQQISAVAPESGEVDLF